MFYKHDSPQCAEKPADAAFRIDGDHVAQVQEAGGAHHFVAVVMIEHVHADRVWWRPVSCVVDVVRTSPVG